MLPADNLSIAAVLGASNQSIASTFARPHSAAYLVYNFYLHLRIRELDKNHSLLFPRRHATDQHATRATAARLIPATRTRAPSSPLNTKRNQPSKRPLIMGFIAGFVRSPFSPLPPSSPYQPPLPVSPPNPPTTRHASLHAPANQLRHRSAASPSPRPRSTSRPSSTSATACSSPSPSASRRTCSSRSTTRTASTRRRRCASTAPA